MLLNARQVFDEDGRGSALLLAIEDVTDRRGAEREKDDLLRQKEILLQEMQHRVANSLQIIASILLLKARTVQSEEIRLHLHDAHQRVMSVATAQQQLQASGFNESIEIGPYLSKLCDSLAKSMIGDRRPLSIKVRATSGAAVSSEVVSLGLIVTELVINALKHAFPSGETGEILVGYDARGREWTFRYRTMAWDLVTLVPRGHTLASARALLKRWPVNSMPLCRNPVAQRGRPSQLLQAQEREGAVDKGSGPLDQRSTKQLMAARSI
jgi:two-component sensor histidine kinase